MTRDKDYILGTHDEEISRLGLQHRVWRPRALDAWRRAGFTTDHTLVDLGCGPGYASIDLAEIVGPLGQVVSIDRSRRFLEALDGMRRMHGLDNITVFELDLDDAPLPAVSADGAWSRWVFAFVKDPRDLLARAAELLKPGAPFVVHEYFDYATWRIAPRCPELEEFVQIVMKSWRAAGGEPDIGLALPGWFGELGFQIRSVKPIVDVVPPTSYVWQWPASFVQVGLDRLVGLSLLSPDRAVAVREAIEAAEKQPGALMITPAVLEIVAVKGR